MLFSSGIDSFIADFYLRNKRIKYRRIYFDIDSNYSAHEIDFLESIYPPFHITKDVRLVLGDMEKSDHYIPNRNMMLATLAQSRYNADVIYINSCLDDRVIDGSSVFRNKLSDILSLNANKQVNVVSILSDMEKADHCLNYVKHVGFAEDLLHKTFSCFDPTDIPMKYRLYEKNGFGSYQEVKVFDSHECLNCKACFRKYSALASIGLFVSFNNKDIIKENSVLSDEFKSYYPSRCKSINEYVNFNKKYIGI